MDHQDTSKAFLKARVGVLAHRIGGLFFRETEKLGRVVTVIIAPFTSPEQKRWPWKGREWRCYTLPQEP